MNLSSLLKAKGHKVELFTVAQEAILFRFRDKIAHLILHVTNRCNFKCHHCFVDQQDKTPELTLAEIDQIADELNDLIWLDIGGGEPFLRDDLHEILGKFRACEYSIPTNGWSTERILRSLGKISEAIELNRLILTMSLDGFPKTHDAIRRQPGSFARARETYFLIRQHFPQLRIKFNTVLHNHNIQEIIPFMRMVQEEMQPAFHSILFLRGVPQDSGYLLPASQEIYNLEEQLLSIQNKYHYGRKGLLSRVQKNYQAVKRDICNRIINQKKQLIPCLAGQAHAVIYPSGGVAPCELLPEIGSVREKPLKNILTSPEWKKAIHDIKSKKCYCTHDCNMLENVLYNFSLYPRFLFGSQHNLR
jgi:MoaA/NifB/PqqE/SkfB family radical SAM enzyme